MSKPENSTLMFTHERGFSTSDGRAVYPQARQGTHGWSQEMETGSPTKTDCFPVFRRRGRRPCETKRPGGEAGPMLMMMLMIPRKGDQRHVEYGIGK